MNKKLNTLLFVLGATVFNLLVMFILMLVFIVALSALFRDNPNPGLVSVLMMVLFVGSIVGTFLIYRGVLNLISRRVDLEKYLLPLFKKKK